MSLRTLPLLLAITSSLAANAVQAATTGTLRFTGQVNAGTCNLAAGDENRTITLPTIKISDLGATSSAGAFDFEISAECESDLRNVIFLFAGTASAGNATLFSNTGTSKGTALRLLHRVSPAYAIPANGNAAQRSRTIASSSNKAVIPLTATYHKTGAAITQGTLASAVTVSITYN
ncbi:major type 1 subunit fimbrin (pilin) [Pseudomonas grimontii]|uniref:Major type 1 subunit fimbrin (Pilin) n=1 Tax=Pseudomonas grimontii TaxID=129847 RepID=A0A1H1CLI3_9PSED|nr:fimbrial protein [Pseudomonas grimontii]TWR69064.1 type 1 fimbrial protein [Pseudomonas grimontii]SDQ65010.1 major type 1 subunit fimbrin (pilin) [Pseudomonas grimontii]